MLLTAATVISQEVGEAGIADEEAGTSPAPSKGKQVLGKGSDSEARVIENRGSFSPWPGVYASRIRSTP